MPEKQLEVKFKKLHEDAVLPSYAKKHDAGMDLTATSVKDLRDEKGYIEYGTGLAAQIPKGHVGLLFPRSSISKSGLMLCNSVGVIDSGYRGEIKLRFREVFRKVKQSWKGTPAVYSKGHKVGQLIIIPIPKIDAVWAQDLSDSERGQGGFGSTTEEDSSSKVSE